MVNRRYKRLPDPWDFEGRVIDGPLVGEWVKEDDPYF